LMLYVLSLIIIYSNIIIQQDFPQLINPI